MAKPQSEQLQEEEKKVADFLKNNPVPEVRVSAGVEQEQAREYQEEKIAERVLNESASSAADRQRIEALELKLKQQTDILSQLLKGKMQGLDESEIVRSPDVPLGAIIKVYIMEDGSPGGSDPVFVSPEGESRYLPRGQFVMVTKAELEVLQNAVYEGQEYPVDKGGNYKSPRRGYDHMELSLPVPYKRPRFNIMVENLLS